MKASESSNASPQGATPPLPENAHRRFAAPEDVLIDRNLGCRERARVLEDWKRELERGSGISKPHELLRRINACRRLLSEQELSEHEH